MKLLGKKPTGARLERMQDSPLWAGEGFRNLHPILPGLRDLTGRRVTLSEFHCGGGERRVPRGPLPSSNPLASWAKPPETGLRATWLGHSTVLIEIEACACSPIRFGAARLAVHPGRAEALQPVPVALSRYATLWSSMVIRSAKHSVFVSGDTGLTNEYTTIREGFGPFDLVMLEVGAFLPVQWGTFSLALHDWDAPAETLLALAPAQGVQLVMPRLGDPVEPSRAEAVTPWWSEDDAPRRSKAAVPAQAPEPMTLSKAMSWPVD